MAGKRSVRRLALEVLLGSRGHVEDRLAEGLETCGLAVRDRGLATELVLGSVRRRGTLDAVAAVASRRPLADLDRLVLEAIRLGLYQLLFCDRIPPHAALGETVEAVKSVGRSHQAGFVNAVLRAAQSRHRPSADDRLAFDRPVFPPLDRDPVGHLAARHAHPAWLVGRWLDRFGRPATFELLEAGNAPPVVSLVPVGVEAARLADEIRGAGFDVRRAEGAATIQVSGGPVASLPGFAAGRFVVQDPAQAAVVEAVAGGPAGRVLDLCAAPGTKAVLLARAGRSVLAVDADRQRIGRLVENVRRLALSGVAPVVADARRLPLAAGQVFEAVLLDAPCSNTGVLARRVEARWRLSPASIESLAALQRELLAAAAARVAPGGRLVYATCSLEDEENDGVVAARPAGFEVVEVRTTLPTPGFGGGYRAVLVRGP